MIDPWVFFAGCLVTSWVVGFTIGAKFRMFKQAVEAISS